MTPDDSTAKVVRRALLRARSSPFKSPQSFTYRERHWTVFQTSSGRFALQLTALLRDEAEMTSYLIPADPGKPHTAPEFATYMTWDGKSTPDVRIIWALADLVLTRILMES